eukprot:1361542-Pyramimonas_sp.AAC.1
MRKAFWKSFINIRTRKAKALRQARSLLGNWRISMWRTRVTTSLPGVYAHAQARGCVRMCGHGAVDVG